MDRREVCYHHHHWLDKPLVGPGLLKKLCPFVSVEGDLLPVLDLLYSHVLIDSISPSQFRSSNSSYSIRFGVEFFFFFYSSVIIHKHHAIVLTLM
jgi:hypothetical protein